MNVLENYHMVSVEEMIASYEAHIISCKPKTLTGLKRMT